MFVRSIVLMSCWLALPIGSAAAQNAPAKLDFPVGEAPVGVPTSTTTPAPAKPTAPPSAAATPASSSAASAAPASVDAAASPSPVPASTPAAVSDVPPPIETAAPTGDLASTPSGYHEVSDDPLFLPGVLSVGGGSAVLLASLFMGLSAHGSYTRLEHDCKNDLCPSGSQGRIDTGKSLAVVSTVLTGVGIVAVGVGAALIIIANNRAPSASEAAPIARLTLTSGPTPLGLGARASF